VEVREINIEKLLGFSSYKHNEKKKIINSIEQKQELFLAWIISGYISDAKYPVRLAVHNIKEGNEVENQYLELARLGWRNTAQLASVNAHIMDTWDGGYYYENEEINDDEGELKKIYMHLSKLAKNEIDKLRETSFVEMIDNVLNGNNE
jgi:hypothetical protein